LAKRYFSIGIIDKTDWFMELRQLRYFLKTKELLSFTSAAKALNISQSTLSQQIGQLENELRIPLFDRIGKRIMLTEAGEMFSKYADQSIKSATDGQLQLNELKNLSAGSVIIGVTHGLSSLLTNALISFTDTYPKINIRIIIGTSEELTDRLNQFELDFAFIFLSNRINDSNYKYRSLFDSPIVFVTALHSELSHRKSITLKEISELNLAIATQIHGNTHFFSQFFKSNNVPYKPAIEINDIPTVLRLVETGRWNTVMVKISVEDRSLACIPIKDVEVKRSAGVLTLKEAYEKQAVIKILEILSDSKKPYV
jgi:LysR family cyn operon transcriptional activator